MLTSRSKAKMPLKNKKKHRNLHFLHALPNAGELKSTDRFCQLIKLAKHLHARARRAILVNA